ncbi:hypothetical protein ECDEC4F_5677 [Escherichia coli DEC4F]|nr:hypothetical protein ECDEC4F_5677 [Escherichia coli DEC4F]
MGNTNWGTEPTNVEKLADDLWLGVERTNQTGKDSWFSPKRYLGSAS